jgi:hypothetical protein
VGNRNKKPHKLKNMIKSNEIIFKNSANELGFSFDGIFSEENLIELHEFAIQSIRTKKPIKLPCNPHPERHPYKGELIINKNYKKFIIGTFPPHTYQADLFEDLTYSFGKKVSKPRLPFYHGNREMLWKYILGEEELNSLDQDRVKRKIQIIEFLKNNKINYADIIDYCQRREYNADDSNLYNIVLNKDLVKLFQGSPSEEMLLVFNTGSFFTSSGMKFNAKEQKLDPKTYVFDMFIYLLIENGYKLDVQIKNEERISISYTNRFKLKRINNILSFNLFINGNKFSVIAGPSPANGDGKLQDNLIFKRFVKKNCPNKSLGFQKKEFKRFVYQTALLGNHHELEFLNFD